MIKRWFVLNPADIAPVQFIIEGYEGMATVTTLDRASAVLQVACMPDFESDIETLMRDLTLRFEMTEIPIGKHPIDQGLI